jgi:hypothetical protein
LRASRRSTVTKIRNTSAERPVKTTISLVVAGLRNLRLKAFNAVKAQSKTSRIQPRVLLRIFLRLVLLPIATALPA